jgi:hypothetical protein
MRHQQILDKLASRELVGAVDEDLARWIGDKMLGHCGSQADLQQMVLPPVLARWRCLLDADNVANHLKNVAWVALATLLHKYGFAEQDITAKALTAIDDLNREVVLSDAFARQSDAIKALLRSTPTPRTRRPPRPKPITFLRPGDAVSIQLDGYFYAAYVLELHRDRGGSFPVIEFYEGRFERLSAAQDLRGRAMASQYGGARFGVIGLTYLPDPANQVVLITSGSVDPPQGAPPRPHRGLWTLTDIMRLQDYVRKLFAGIF